MTRNEAAALATIARMGWVSFTVRMLQQAIGLSYHQVRRILQGYTARGTVYCGLLEKCPALAVVDVTVIDESTGTTVRRHESHFQFDAERYREWVAELAVWLEDEGEGEEDSPPPSGGSCNAADACCKGECKDGCKEIAADENEQRGEDGGNGSDSAEMSQDNQRSFATSSGSHGSPDPAPREIHREHVQVRSVSCGSRTVANERIENGDSSTNRKHLNAVTSLSAKSVCNTVCTPLCNTVTTAAKGVRPLSGVLDPKAFARVQVEIGRCDIRSAAKAAYRSQEAQTNVCEGCYARLVREGRTRGWG